MEAVTHVKQASVKTFVSGRQETLSSILLPCLTHCLYKLLIKSHFFVYSYASSAGYTSTTST